MFIIHTRKNPREDYQMTASCDNFRVDQDGKIITYWCGSSEYESKFSECRVLTHEKVDRIEIWVTKGE